MASEPLHLTDLEGVGSITANRLKEAGFTTIESIAVTPKRELMEKTGISEETATTLLLKVRKSMGLDLITALELFDKRLKAQRITTASKNLDTLIGGGIETQAITEFVGEYGTGKSQICMQLCITAQQPPEKGGLGGKILFIDTEGTFSPQRINDIAEKRGFDPKKTLENIIYARCYNSDHQILLVDRASKVIEEEKIKLIIVDSLISHFRGEYVGREMLSERQQKLNQHIHKLLRLAELYNCAVVVTNQIQSNPQAFFGDPNRPAGGQYCSSCLNSQIVHKEGKSEHTYNSRD